MLTTPLILSLLLSKLSGFPVLFPEHALKASSPACAKALLVSRWRYKRDCHVATLLTEHVI